jgi:hypothetical protein
MSLMLATGFAAALVGTTACITLHVPPSAKFQIAGCPEPLLL